MDFDLYDAGTVISDSGPMDLSTALQVALNTVVNAGAESLAQRISVTGSQAAVQPAALTTAMPGAFALGPLLGGVGRALGAAGGAVVGVLRSAGGRVLGWILPSGRRVTRKAAVAMAKQFGLIAAASALGATVEDLAQAVLDEEAKPRRGRGITASQLRTTRRTIGKVERAHKQLAQLARRHVR